MSVRGHETRQMLFIVSLSLFFVPSLMVSLGLVMPFLYTVILTTALCRGDTIPLSWMKKFEPPMWHMNRVNPPRNITI